MRSVYWALIIDDSPGQAEAAAKVFRQNGITAEAFTVPDEALKFATEHKGQIAFVMFDYLLKGSKGTTYARTFRAQKLATDIALATAYSDTIPLDEMEEMQRLGISVYDKPVNLPQLIRDKLQAYCLESPEQITSENTAGIPRKPLDESPERISPQNTAGLPRKSLDESTVSALTRTFQSEFELLRNRIKELSSLDQRTAKIEGLIEGRHQRETMAVGKRQIGVALAMGLLGAVLAIALFFIGQRSCGSKDKATNATESNAAFILAENPVPLSSLTIIADKRGLFKAHGLDLEVRAFPSGKLALDAVVDGGAAFGTVAETPIMFAAFAGLPIVVVGTIGSSDLDCRVVARMDLGVRKPADLKGKKVATAIGTSAEFFMHAFLSSNGLSDSDVQVVTLKPQEMVTALLGGNIAAFFIWQPYIYQAQQALGTRAIVFNGKDVYTETFNIVTTRDFATKHPETVRAFLRSLLDAEDFSAKTPSEAISLVAGYTGMDEAVMKNVWPEFNFRVMLQPLLLKFLSQEAEWAIHTGKVNSAVSPDFRHILDTEPLNALRPDAVTIQ